MLGRANSLGIEQNILEKKNISLPNGFFEIVGLRWW